MFGFLNIEYSGRFNDESSLGKSSKLSLNSQINHLTMEI